MVPPPPTITSILPNTGSTLGGTSVTISGTGFVSGSTSVKFDSIDASNIVVDASGITITCITPTDPTIGSVNVTVNTPGGSATLPSGYNLVHPPPRPTIVSNVCFPAGTPVMCDQGEISIEKINPEINTIRGKKIVAITRTITQDKHLICFEKDSLHKNIPSQKTLISINHKIFYKGEMKKAKEFVGDFENIKKVKYTGEVLYNVLMEKPDKMLVNNLICETLHPENCIAKLYRTLQGLTIQQQNELINKLNKYAIENNIFNKKNKSKKTI